MLLRETKELESYLPTSKWRNANALLSYVEEEEQNAVIPILGEELFGELVNTYEKMSGEFGGVTPDILPAQYADLSVRLIRLCQKIQLYLALANNAGLLAVSFNQGGGFNVVSSDNYDPADKESLNRMERDAFRKAHRNVDALLAELERDAKRETPQYAELWKQSDYFYFKAGLLISRADILQNYLNIQGSRERYIELVPDLRYAQSTYLTPALGRELMQAFVERNTRLIPVPPAASEEEDEEKAEQMHEWAKVQRMRWLEAEDLLRAAMSCYTEHRNTKLRRPDSLTDADMSLARAVAVMREHTEYFMPYIQSAPFYEEPAQGGSEQQADDPRCICGEPAHFDPCDPNNAITVLRPGLRRF